MKRGGTVQVNYQDQWELGRAGEHAAIRWYEDEGYTLLGHRQRMRAGEIDAVVEDEDGTVVFVEVKSRRGTAFGAAEAVTTKKLNTLRRGELSGPVGAGQGGGARRDQVVRGRGLHPLGTPATDARRRDRRCC